MAGDLPALVLLLLDSRAPTGASNHSAGMEAAVTAGWVRDLKDAAAFCSGRLRTSGQVAAAFAAAACREPGRWAELDDEFSARTSSEAMRAASRQLGGGLRRLLRAMVPEFAEWDARWGSISPHQPIVLGVGCALAGATPTQAARAAALGIVTAPASAAVRLLGLDPYTVHAVLGRLAPDIDSLAATWGEPGVRFDLQTLPADCAVALDLLADVHVQEEVRLFAS
jgi:urease accessory protein